MSSAIDQESMQALKCNTPKVTTDACLSKEQFEKIKSTEEQETIKIEDDIFNDSDNKSKLTTIKSLSNALLLISRQRLKREKKDESKNEEKITLYNIDEESSWNIESESFAEETKSNEESFSRNAETEISECFKLFDANGSGMISANKLYIAVSELGLNFLQDEVDELMNAVDERGLGGITFNRFKVVMRETIMQGTTDTDLLNVFNIFDKTNDGYVTATDLQLAFRQCGEMLTPEECLKFINECSNNEKGLFSFDEFKAYYKKTFSDYTESNTENTASKSTN